MRSSSMTWFVSLVENSECIKQADGLTQQIEQFTLPWHPCDVIVGTGCRFKLFPSPFLKTWFRPQYWYTHLLCMRCVHSTSTPSLFLRWLLLWLWKYWFPIRPDAPPPAISSHPLTSITTWVARRSHPAQHPSLLTAFSRIAAWGSVCWGQHHWQTVLS